MTKPSDFIINSDYLSIAEFDRNELTVITPPRTIEVYDTYEFERNFSVPAQYGTIDRVQISMDGTNYCPSANARFDFSDHYVWIKVNRTSATNINVLVGIKNLVDSQISVPTKTININIASFKAPNVV